MRRFYSVDIISQTVYTNIEGENMKTSKCGKIVLPRWNDLPNIDLYMDQVIAFLLSTLDFMRRGDSEKDKVVTPSIINNYVKLGMIPAPIKKKYSKEHIAKLIILCTLKQVMPLSTLKTMLEDMLSLQAIDVVYDNFCADFEEIAEDAFVYVSDKKIDASTRSATALKISIRSSVAKLVADDIMSTND